jgi:hypothetical protein
LVVQVVVVLVAPLLVQMELLDKAMMVVMQITI